MTTPKIADGIKYKNKNPENRRSDGGSATGGGYARAHSESAARLHLVEARLCGELRDGGADLPEHLLGAEVVAFGVVHLDLKPLCANL